MEIVDSLTGLIYLWIIAILASFSAIGAVLQPLKDVGRMALTNYLSLSVIGMVLFSGLGLGLYETLSPAELFGLVWLVITAQLLWSPVWLSPVNKVRA